MEIQPNVCRAGMRVPLSMAGTAQECVGMTLSPLACSSADGWFVRYGGTEFCTVTEGTLTLLLGFEKYDFSAGDSVEFDASVPHLYVNNGDVPVVARRRRTSDFPEMRLTTHSPTDYRSSYNGRSTSDNG